MPHLVAFRYARAFLLLVAPLGMCFSLRATEITVRALSAKTGRPQVEAWITVGINLSPEMARERHRANVSQHKRTDADGRATFEITLPPNPLLFVSDGKGNQCSRIQYNAAHIREILERGMSDYHCPHRPKKFLSVQPRPGEIIIFDGEYTGLERGLYFPWAT